MARSRSDDKRTAILSAAIRQTASQGRVAATAPIAKDAGVSNGSLFTYFEMGAAALDGLPTDADLREHSRHMCSHWLSWDTLHAPDKPRSMPSGAWSATLSKKHSTRLRRADLSDLVSVAARCCGRSSR